MSVVTRIRTSQECTVPFTPDEVWNVLADVGAYPRWWPAIGRVEVLPQRGPLLGAEFEVRPFMGRTFRIRFEEMEGRQSLRLRFFGGSLEGPGGFHLRAVGNGTQVRYEMDVFTRGMRIAVLSQVLPYDWIHRSRMRRVLRRLTSRLKAVRRAGKPEAVRQPVVAEFAPVPPTQACGSNFDVARRYLEALSSRATPGQVAPFLSPAAVQEEFPHRFLQAAITRNYDAILEARKRALSQFASERFELVRATGGGSQVAMEIRWKGVVATTDGAYKEGQELEARLAMFLKLDEGRIVRERSYACFEPWSSAAERKTVLDERVAQAGQSSPVVSPGGAASAQTTASNFDIARSYLETLGARADAEAIARFFAPGATQDVFPNGLLPGGAHRDVRAIKEARSRGLAFLSSENYDLIGATGGGSAVALEVSWRGVVGEGGGLFTVGQVLEARTAIFLKFHEGLIVAQRNYDCAYNFASAPPGSEG